jgi:PAS domain S-box-containing protein
VDINRSNNRNTGWPFADGEMAQRVRTHDWAATSLGPVEQWPVTLRMTVKLVLAHPFANVVLWGPELVQIYNDGYRELMGLKPPAGLGQPTRECWPEVWYINAPIYERVWNGESFFFKGAHYPIMRAGALEDAWFTLSYSPVRDDAGAVAGVLVTVIEATHRVRTEQALRDSKAQVRHTAELLEQVIESAPDPIWTKDLDGRWVVVNSAAAAVIGHPRESLIGLHSHDALPADFADVVIAEDQDILKEGTILRNEETLFDASRGETRIFLSIRAPLRAADGSITGLLGIARDITERKAAEAQLAELNATLEKQVRERTHALQQLAERERAILASAASAIIATDLDGRINAFNPAAEAMFRMPVAQALGRPVLDLYDPEDLQAHLGDFPPEMLQVVLPQAGTQIQGSPGPRRGEWRFVRADGTRFPGLLSESVLRDAQGTPIGLLGVITDLTERKTLEEQLRQRTRQAEAATAAKSAFLAHMSHEIRTPLNAVIGLSQLLAQTCLDERQRKFVTHVNAAGEHLLALVNDILDVSKIEAGEMRLESTPFELPALLQQACAIVEMQAEEKELHLEFELDPALPQRLVGDPTRLKQVLANLLGNAVKFTDAGSVTLRVTQLVLEERARADPGPLLSTLRIEVSDTGIGIPREKQAAIFQPFTQADATTTRRFGGTGLGLSIVQRLVKLMGGCLDLKSEPGKGSTFGFTVTLPVAK